MYAVWRMGRQMGILDHGVIMRSFYSGRRFSCLEVLLALFLSAPISLNAQSGSSPQSQPAQSAASAPSPQRNRKHRVRLLAPTLLPF